MGCMAKVVEATGTIGTCTKCGMKMKMTKCPKKSVVRLRLEDDVGATYTVTAFQQVVKDTVRDQEGADDIKRLLNAPMMKLTITNLSAAAFYLTLDTVLNVLLYFVFVVVAI